MKPLSKTLAAIRPTFRALAAACACVTGFGAAQLGLGSGDANLNGIASIPLTLQSDLPVVALQVDVMANPAVASFSVPVSGGALGSHFAEGAQIGSNTFRIVLYSLFNQALPNGTILALDAAVSPAFPSGTLSLTLTNALLAGPAATALSGVALGSGIIRVGGASAVQLGSVALTPAGALRFEVSGLTGASFDLEQSIDLKTWSVAETLPVSGPNATLTRNLPAGAGAQFYRVRLP